MLARAAGWAGLALLMALAAAFAAHSVGRGLSVRLPGEMATSRFILGTAGDYALHAHMVTGGLLTVLAPLQALRAVRARRRLHRAAGRGIVALALVTGAGGLAHVALRGTVGGPWMSANFAIYGALLIWAALGTWRAARARAPSHPAWAARLVVLALGSLLYRVLYGVNEMATGGAGVAGDGSFTGAFDLAAIVLFYLPGLLAVEVWARGRRLTGAGARGLDRHPPP